METKTLLNTLSSQLQALVEASLGTKLPPSATATAIKLKLNPSELFALKHPESPGFIVKEGFLGRQNALAVRNALNELAQRQTFNEAKVGAGGKLHSDRAMRGDKILWIQTPRDLDHSTGDKSTSFGAILHLQRQVESLVYGLKKVSSELDLRNVVSTQLAMFPGNGARFVKHFDTYSNVQRDECSVIRDGLVRLITCVYYLNDQWEPEHGGHLRIHLKESKLLPACQWDVPPKLDTLMVFRSLDVEHEVLPMYCERKALTICKIRVRWVDYRQAAGPCVARAQAQKLWQGEEFYLQIDSHMRFRLGWDCFLINELGKCVVSKPILTTYPLGYTLPSQIPVDCRPTLLCASAFDELGMLRQTSKMLTKALTEPLPSLFWAAGFAFSSSKMIAEVPYDEELRFLFFWGRIVDGCATLDFRELETEETKQCRDASAQYVKHLLRVNWTSNKEECKGKYAKLGSERSFDSYQKHIGIDFATGDIEWRAEWGNLDPIQFDLKPNTEKPLTPV
ncbi:unnamed protein product [Peronospora destructor]|uniref:Prolyl 4-hydroxylase alpha subunit domain-containing protein n=1 Tax=Peronospora destructor TaxID=86335 RepID=A0AAV0TBS4_9STRA|nr:unnamed protein product [Peronospora destructor]